MKFFFSFFIALSVGVVFAAEPSAMVENVTFTQDPSSALVTVSYDLSTTSIMTLDILTNGVSIGAANLRRLTGDVNRKVTAGEGKMIYWSPKETFAGQLVNDGSMTAVVTAWNEGNPPDYLVADLSITNSIRYYVSADALPLDVTNEVYKLDKLVMRRIRASGVPWRMGTPRREVGAEANEVADLSIPHVVTLTNDYYIGIFQVTERQYYLLSGGVFGGGAPALEGNSFRVGTWNDYFDASKLLPAENMSFKQLRGSGVTWPTDGHRLGADGNLYKARQLTGLKNLDLPTEAQWEYACRTGLGTSYSTGYDCSLSFDKAGSEEVVNNVAWYGSYYNGTVAKADNRPQAVGTKAPNAWGLYDMHGNIFEMCLDWYSSGADYRATFAPGWASGKPTIEPVGPSSGTQHVYRGGDYYNSASRLRASYRYTWSTFGDDFKYCHNGFRLACVIEGK